MNIPEGQQKLLFGAIELDNSKSLQFYEIQKEDTIILAVDLHVYEFEFYRSNSW